MTGGKDRFPILVGNGGGQEGTVLQVEVEHDEYGFYAFCPELPGCQTQGDTFAEAVTNIHEAAGLYLASLED